MNSKRQKILLIDTGVLGYAAMFAMREIDLTNEEGLKTDIIYNFLLRVHHIATLHKSGDLIFCFDSPRKYSKRKEAYPEYKEGREDNLSEGELQLRAALYEQIDVLKTDILPAMGFKNIFEVKGFEADDIIAYVAKHYDAEFIMITADNDMFQCLKDDVSMYDPDPRRLRTITKESFIEKYDIQPEQWGLVKCLAGCSGDHVGGIVGVGEKTAIKYIKGELPSHYKIFTKLINEESNIIDRNTPLVVLPHPDFPDIELMSDEITEEKLETVFQKYNFNSFLKPDKWIEWKGIFNV